MDGTRALLKVPRSPADNDLMAWFIRYAADAVAHGHLPALVTTALNAPHGINLMLNNSMLVGETRLQDSITGPARATVTSVLGLLEELVALLVYVTFAVASHALGFPTLVALLGGDDFLAVEPSGRHEAGVDCGPAGLVTGRRTVRLASGSEISALDAQMEYYTKAVDYVASRGTDPISERVLDLWGRDGDDGLIETGQHHGQHQAREDQADPRFGRRLHWPILGASAHSDLRHCDLLRVGPGPRG